jgi:hypothetical protein
MLSASRLPASCPPEPARCAVRAADDPAEQRAPQPDGAAARALPGRLLGQNQPGAVATLQGGARARLLVVRHILVLAAMAI